MTVAIIWLTTGIVTFLSFRKDKGRTRLAFKKAYDSAKKIAPNLLVMIAIVGLTLAILPADQIVRLFQIKGLFGFLIVALTGSLITLPGPIAFPLAGALLAQGADPAVLATFITTLTMVGLATSAIEISHFGRRFTILRQCFSFVAAIMIGTLMGVFL